MMETIVATAFLAAVIGALAGFLAGKLARPRPLRDAEDATIFIYDSPQGLTAKVVPSVIAAAKNGKIDWTIADLTPLADGDDVDFEWIAHPHGTPPVGKNPLQSFVRERKLLKGKIKGEVKRGDKFRYLVRVNSKVLVDPDVEIVY